MSRRFIILLRWCASALVLCWTLSAPVHGYVFLSTPPRLWPDGTIPMDLQLGPTLPTPLKDGSTSFNSAATNALATWNQYIITAKFTASTGASKQPRNADGVNQVFF